MREKLNIFLLKEKLNWSEYLYTIPEERLSKCIPKYHSEAKTDKDRLHTCWMEAETDL
jgi:hypothetical protein